MKRGPIRPPRDRESLRTASPRAAGDPSRLIPARFVSRPNRFEVVARLEAGGSVRCHLADPGRLKELLVPNALLGLRRAAPGSTRKTRYTVSLIRAATPPHPWVSAETHRANQLAEVLLRTGKIRGVGKGWDIRREVRRGRSRFDFLLTRGRQEMFVEAKSVTLVEDHMARFPDAPTVRGTRHVRELTEIARDGGRALVLFIVQRADGRVVTPARSIDPDFARALSDAKAAGVLLRAWRFLLLATGSARSLGPVRVRPI